MRREIASALILALALLPAGAGAEEDVEKGKEKETPALAIVSRLGTKRDVKLYNDEPVVFLARPAAGGPPLRGVSFVLYDEGGSPDRSECVRARTEDARRWGKPPSSFGYPLRERVLPVGRYRLLARKPGYAPAEVKVVVARFVYFDLEVRHDKDSYRASFRIRLVDKTETRQSVPVSVRVESAQGGLVDSSRVGLARVRHKDATYESIPVRLSSRAKPPDPEKPAVSRALRVVPRASLVLVIGKLRFRYPVPLPLEKKKATTQEDLERRLRGR
ncbi:MAG: hypothetical protein ACYTDY_05815 [Planctomycetota bacterium]|jgi:hypothetical protein